MSVTLLPPSYNARPSALLPVGPPAAKRPKLTLNTSTVESAFGKKSTSLRLDALSATSPTARNTFKNAAEGGEPLARQRIAPLDTNPRTPSTLRIDSQDSDDTSDSHSHFSSVASDSSYSTLDSGSGEAPLKASNSALSIADPDPLLRTKSWRMSLRPVGAPTKRVSFRAPLEEEIQTSTYTMKHSDLESSTSTISTLELPPPADDDDSSSNDRSQHSAGVERAPAEMIAGHQRNQDKQRSSGRAPETEAEAGQPDTCPNTPVAGRRKKDTRWMWTLGPIRNDEQPQREQEESAGKTNG